MCSSVTVVSERVGENEEGAFVYEAVKVFESEFDAEDWIAAQRKSSSAVYTQKEFTVR